MGGVNLSEDILCAGGCFINTVDGTQRIEKSFESEFRIRNSDEKEMALMKVLVRLSDHKGGRYRNFGFAWDKLYRRKFIERNELAFDTGAVGKCAWIDALFCFNAFAAAEEIRGVPCIGYHYREVLGSITKGYNRNLPEAYEAFFHELKNTTSQQEVRTPLQEAMNARTMEAMYGILNRTLFHPGNPQTAKQVYQELAEIKTKKCFHDAIYSKDNTYLTTKEILLKYLLRCSKGTVLRTLWRVNQYRKKARQH